MRRLLLVAAALAGAVGLAPAAHAEKNPITLALLGPMSGADAAAGQAMRRGVRLYIEQLNHAGGLDGRKVALKTYDTQSDPERATKLARQIGKSDAAAAIGAYYSSVSVAAADILENRGVPAITGSATAPRLTAEHSTYFRVVPDNARQGQFIARYMEGVLNVDRVAVAYEQDAYGQSLKREFEDAAQRVGLRRPVMAGVDSSRADKDAQLDRLAAQILGEGQDTPVFLGLLGTESAELVKRLRIRGHTGPIVGGDAVGLASFQNRIAELAGGEASQAQLTDGIYATTYFLSDVANLRGQRFVDAFTERFGNPPPALAATNYSAAQLAALALKRAGAQGDAGQLRQRIVAELGRIDSLKTSVVTPLGRVHFDATGSAVKSSPFGRYQQGRLISAPVQLTPVVEAEARLDLAQERAAGNIVEFEDTVYYKTNVVYVGLDINDIAKVDQNDQQFAADFYIWLRHGRPLDPESLQFTNAVNPEAVDLDSVPVQADQVNGTHYRAFRVEGTFHAPFDFHHYPFDSQTLPIRLRHKTAAAQRVRFVVDDLGLQRHQGRTPEEQLKNRGVLAEDRQWALQDVILGADVAATNSTLGDPRLFGTGVDTGISHSRFNVLTRIERNAATFAMKNLVPLALLLLVGYATLYIVPLGPPFVARMNLAVTALLTVVFFANRVAGQLPDIGYLVAIDYLFFGIYGIFLLTIAITIVQHLAYKYEREGLVHRLELTGRIAYPGLSIAVVIGMLAAYA